MNKGDRRLIFEWLTSADAKLPLSIEWLEKQSPDTWHVIATGWNYDYRADPLLWIVSQSACDRGTALCVFLKEASSWVKYPDPVGLNEYYQICWGICEAVSRRWKEKLYPSFKFLPLGADLPSDYSQYVKIFKSARANAIEALGVLPWDLPDDAFQLPSGLKEPDSIYSFGDNELRYRLDYWEHNIRKTP